MRPNLTPVNTQLAKLRARVRMQDRIAAMGKKERQSLHRYAARVMAVSGCSFYEAVAVIHPELAE